MVTETLNNIRGNHRKADVCWLPHSLLAKSFDRDDELRVELASLQAEVERNTVLLREALCVRLAK